LKKKNDHFLIGRLKSIRYAMRGVWFLITTEASIKVQLFIAIMSIVAGFYFQISTTEWLIQVTIIGLVLMAESLNTGIEKLSDFIHPEYHKKIGFIKDISAGSVAIVAILSLIIAGIIYLPKIALLF